MRESAQVFRWMRMLLLVVATLVPLVSGCARSRATIDRMLTMGTYNPDDYLDPKEFDELDRNAREEARAAVARQVDSTRQPEQATAAYSAAKDSDRSLFQELLSRKDVTGQTPEDPFLEQFDDVAKAAVKPSERQLTAETFLADGRRNRTEVTDRTSRVAQVASRFESEIDDFADQSATVTAKHVAAIERNPFADLDDNGAIPRTAPPGESLSMSALVDSMVDDVEATLELDNRHNALRNDALKLTDRRPSDSNEQPRFDGLDKIASGEMSADPSDGPNRFDDFFGFSDSVFNDPPATNREVLRDLAASKTGGNFGQFVDSAAFGADQQVASTNPFAASLDAQSPEVRSNGSTTNDTFSASFETVTFETDPAEPIPASAAAGVEDNPFAELSHDDNPFDFNQNDDEMSSQAPVASAHSDHRQFESRVRANQSISLFSEEVALPANPSTKSLAAPALPSRSRFDFSDAGSVTASGFDRNHFAAADSVARDETPALVGNSISAVQLDNVAWDDESVASIDGSPGFALTNQSTVVWLLIGIIVVLLGRNLFLRSIPTR